MHSYPSYLGGQLFIAISHAHAHAHLRLSYCKTLAALLKSSLEAQLIVNRFSRDLCLKLTVCLVFQAHHHLRFTPVPSFVVGWFRFTHISLCLSRETANSFFTLRGTASNKQTCLHSLLKCFFAFRLQLSLEFP